MFSQLGAEDPNTTGTRRWAPRNGTHLCNFRQEKEASKFGQWWWWLVCLKLVGKTNWIRWLIINCPCLKLWARRYTAVSDPNGLLLAGSMWMSLSNTGTPNRNPPEGELCTAHCPGNLCLFNCFFHIWCSIWDQTILSFLAWQFLMNKVAFPSIQEKKHLKRYHYMSKKKM